MVSDENGYEISIVMACFNEEATIKEIIERVLSNPIVGELIIIDDASTDNSLKIVLGFDDSRITVLTNDKNRGKGFSISRGLNYASRTIVGIQDADLEYDPREYARIVEPIVSGRADVVYGSRFKGFGPVRVMYFWHYAANKILTLMSNIFTNLNLSDMETCYKFFRREVLNNLQLREKRFGIEPEITIKLASKNLRFYEVPITYDGRTYEQGKKIRLKDAIRAVFCIIFYGIQAKI